MKSDAGDLLLTHGFADCKQYASASEGLISCVCDAFSSEAGYQPKVEQGEHLEIKRVDYLVARRYQVTYRPAILDFTPSECVACDGTGHVECVACDGRGDVKCESCGGKGWTECSSCDGKGWTECSSCDGTGWTECSYCSGTGEYDDWWSGDRVTCPECDGKGKVKCTWCEGKGKFDCSTCEGSGQVECGTCEGSGSITCSACGGAGTVDCTECSGTGDPPQELLDKAGKLTEASVERVSFKMPGFGARATEGDGMPQWRLEGDEILSGDELSAVSWFLVVPYALGAVGVLAAVAALLTWAIFVRVRRARRRHLGEHLESAEQQLEEELQPQDVSVGAPASEASPFCSQCGTPISATSAFCTHCGAARAAHDGPDLAKDA